MQATMISLLCQWACHLLPQPTFRWEPEAEIVQWTDGGGVHVGDYTNFLATADQTTLSQFNAGGGGITAFYNIGTLPALNTFQVTVSPGLTNLDLTGCASLTYLDFNGCSVNTLVGLDDCTSLQTLYAFNNLLAGPLDLSVLTQIQTFDVSQNPLTSLDCTGLINLTSFSAQFCNLSSIDITGSPNITQFWVDGNPLLDDNITGP